MEICNPDGHCDSDRNCDYSRSNGMHRVVTQQNKAMLPTESMACFFNS